MAAVLRSRARSHIGFWLRSSTVLPSRWESTSRNQLKKIVQETLEGIKAAGTWKSERVIVSHQAACIKVQEQESGVINFCANNYLGLAVRGTVYYAGYLYPECS